MYHFDNMMVKLCQIMKTRTSEVINIFNAIFQFILTKSSSGKKFL